MALTAALSLGRYMTTVTVEPDTPCQVAPPLPPPAHWATHGGCSRRPVTQNDFPVVEPLAGADVPLRLAMLLPPDPVGATPAPPGPEPEPAAGPPPPGVLLPPSDDPPLPPAPGPTAPGDADVPGCTPGNSPPSGPFAELAPRDGATTTSTIWAATNRANGAYRRSGVTRIPPGPA